MVQELQLAGKLPTLRQTIVLGEHAPVGATAAAPRAASQRPVAGRDRPACSEPFPEAFDAPPPRHAGSMSFDDLRWLGRSEAGLDAALERRKDGVRPGSAACIQYTSGTTGWWQHGSLAADRRQLVSMAAGQHSFGLAHPPHRQPQGDHALPPLAAQQRLFRRPGLLLYRG